MIKNDEIEKYCGTCIRLKQLGNYEEIKKVRKLMKTWNRND